MLERGNSRAAGMPAPSDVKLIDIDYLIGILLRQAKIIVLCLALGLMLGIAILMLTPRTYQAASQIVIERQLDGLAPEVLTASGQMDIEAQILNQVEVIGSTRLARIVAEAENLTTDVEFLNPPPSMMQNLMGLIENAFALVTGSSQPEQPELLTEAPVEAVVDALRGGVKVTRVGRSSVIWLGYETHSPELAYRIANAYAAAFVQDQLNADLEVTREAAEWLRERLAELSNSQREVALEIEAFRLETGLTVSTDTTLTNQRLENLTSQIVLAQADVARYQAIVSQLDRITADDPHGIAAGLASVPVENDADAGQLALLREAYLSAERRIAEVSALYGDDHPQIAALRQEQLSLTGQLQARLAAVTDRYRRTLDMSRLRVEELRGQVEAEGQSGAESNPALIRLTALQQRSDALNLLYRSYLTRYEETLQEQSFPIPAARVISDASVPRAATGPRRMTTLGAALVFGGFLGLVFSTLNELRERSFRVGSQVTRETGLRFLGYLPLVPVPRRGDKISRSRQVHAEIRRQITGRRATAPTTLLAETLKAVKIAINAKRIGDEGVVVGIVSVLPGEGKTSLAVGLAELAAHDGNSVLLIDADLRSAMASALIVPEHPAGMAEVGRGTPWREAIYRDKAGFDMIPARSPGSTVAGSDDLATPFMRTLLDEARHAYDLVVIDLPPLGAMVDAVSIHPWTDGFILVAEWGQTPRRLVRGVIEREPQLAEDMIGVVLNRVRLDKLPRYSNPGDTERFVTAYPEYFRVPAGKS
jgi:succinoglycan biosynthesis transport protein ExoP